MNYEAKVREAVQKAQANGWTICDRQSLIDRESKQCCPIGALGIDDPEIDSFGQAFASVFGDEARQTYWYMDFAHAFDGAPNCSYGNQDAFKLGQQMREELL